jgi:hypothetical protein
MRTISATIVALMISSGLVFAASPSGPMSIGNIDGATILLVANTKPPPKVIIPPGAHNVTKGQKGKCICSTSAGPPPHTVCTGRC